MLVQFEEVAAVCGRPANLTTRSYFNRLMREGKFPAARQVSQKRIAWKRDEIEAWIASRPAVRYAGSR